MGAGADFARRPARARRRPRDDQAAPCRAAPPLRTVERGTARHVQEARTDPSHAVRHVHCDGSGRDHLRCGDHGRTSGPHRADHRRLRRRRLRGTVACDAEMGRSARSSAERLSHTVIVGASSASSAWSPPPTRPAGSPTGPWCASTATRAPRPCSKPDPTQRTDGGRGELRVHLGRQSRTIVGESATLPTSVKPTAEVQVDRRVVRLDAQADPLDPTPARLSNDRLEQEPSDPFTSAVLDHTDRQLGHVLCRRSRIHVARSHRVRFPMIRSQTVRLQMVRLQMVRLQMVRSGRTDTTRRRPEHPDRRQRPRSHRAGANPGRSAQLRGRTSPHRQIELRAPGRQSAAIASTSRRKGSSLATACRRRTITDECARPVWGSAQLCDSPSS